MKPCPPPLDHTEPASYALPDGAIDCHAHVVSADHADALVPNRSYTPPPAPEAAYLGMLRATGMTRGVLIQISVYGTENSYLLEVLGRHPDQLRGVAVTAPEVEPAHLSRMHEAGVRALRLNVLFGGGIDFTDMELLARKAAALDWHLELLLDSDDLPDLADRILALPVPVVIDHMGHHRPTDPAGEPGRTALRRLLDTGTTWVKLSGAYRTDPHDRDHPDASAFARTLLRANPERVVYGSDWPHVAVPGLMPDTGHLRNLLPAWTDHDPALLHKLLVTNPETLYQFPPTGPHREGA